MKHASFVIPIVAASIANISFSVYRTFLTSFPDQIYLYEQLTQQFERKSPHTISTAKRLEKNLGITSKVPVFPLIEYELNSDDTGREYKGEQDNYIDILKFYIDEAVRTASVPLDSTKNFSTFKQMHQLALFLTLYSFQTVLKAVAIVITHFYLLDTDYKAIMWIYKSAAIGHIETQTSGAALAHLAQIANTRKHNQHELFLPERIGKITLDYCSDTEKYVDKIRKRLDSPIDIWDAAYFPCSCSSNTRDIIDIISRFRIHIASSISDFDSLVVLMREFDWTTVPRELVLLMKLQIFGGSSLHSFNPIYHGSSFQHQNQLPLFISFMSSHLNLSPVVRYVAPKSTHFENIKFLAFPKNSLIWLFYQGAHLYTPFFSKFTMSFSRIASHESGFTFEQMYFDINLLYTKTLIEIAAEIDISEKRHAVDDLDGYQSRKETLSKEFNLALNRMDSYLSNSFGVYGRVFAGEVVAFFSDLVVLFVFLELNALNIKISSINRGRMWDFFDEIELLRVYMARDVLHSDIAMKAIFLINKVFNRAFHSAYILNLGIERLYFSTAMYSF